VYFLVLLLALDGLLALVLGDVSWFGEHIGEAGGAAGRMLTDLLVKAFNPVGTAILLLVLLVVSAMAALRYHKPPLSLLDHEGEAAKPVDRDALMMQARILEKKLQDFNVQGEIVEVKPGPVVTMYEFAPAPGSRSARLPASPTTSPWRSRRSPSASSLPFPGRGVVGIEIPNRDRETVYLKEIFASEEFQKTGGRLPMALGKDIFGRTVVSDLAKMPHLLVAGSTGSGKSVSINTMVLSLLYRATPEDVRIIMVDPKMLELSIYEGIPHLLLPVVTNPKKAALAFNWAVREMERRYKLMADKGVRNIDGYNKKIAKEEKEKEDLKARGKVVVEEVDPDEAGCPIIELAEGEELEHGHLPFIVVIVDELADLMMVAGREIEESIARLAQMARAAGIHLILATQRPSVDVITGLIKANFPTRLSFKVFPASTRAPSSTRWARKPCSAWATCSSCRPAPAPCSASTAPSFPNWRCKRVVDFLKKQGEPQYDKSILTAPAGATKPADRRRRRLRREMGRSPGHGRRDPPGLHLHAAARSAPRLQPGRANDRKDGAGGNRRPLRRHQPAAGGFPQPHRVVTG
jgi:DNA segregation ATPase FtsK/SpoIIIE, S-DNA-T family